jgi:hypothetical protein
VHRPLIRRLIQSGKVTLNEELGFRLERLCVRITCLVLVCCFGRRALFVVLFYLFSCIASRGQGDTHRDRARMAGLEGALGVFSSFFSLPPSPFALQAVQFTVAQYLSMLVRVCDVVVQSGRRGSVTSIRADQLRWPIKQILMIVSLGRHSTFLLCRASIA